MACLDTTNCDLLSHCLVSISAANSSPNGSQDDGNVNVEVEFESASNEHLHLIVNYLNTWRQRKCPCVVRRSGHYSLVSVLFMLTTKSLVEEIEKLCAIFHSLDDNSNRKSESNTDHNQANSTDDSPDNVTQRAKSSRPSTPLVSEELEDLLQAVEVIFSQEFPLSNQYYSKSNILNRVLKNLILKQHFMRAMTELLRSSSPQLLPLNFVHLSVKLVSSVLRCVAQETGIKSGELRLVSLAQKSELRSSLVHYMKQLCDDDLRSPKARQAIEFCWERIQDLSLDAIDTDCLDLALKYIKSSTLTMRLSGLGFMNQQIGLCERKPANQSYRSGGSTAASSSRCHSPSHSQQGVVNTKTTLKRWLKSQMMVSVLFGANTHVELVRQCHPIMQFMASGQLLTECDIDVLWSAVNDKHKSREVVSAIEGVLHFLSDTLLERFKVHLQELAIQNHTEQTFSLSCQITKTAWRRQLMTLNLAHQFGNIVASEKRKRKHRSLSNVSADAGSSNPRNSQSDSSTTNLTPSKQTGNLLEDQQSVESSADCLTEKCPNAVVTTMSSSPVLITHRPPRNPTNKKPQFTNNNQHSVVEKQPPGVWVTCDDEIENETRSDVSSKNSVRGNVHTASSDGDCDEETDHDRSSRQVSGDCSELKNETNNSSATDKKNDSISKRRRIDRKISKYRGASVPPPPPPPLRINPVSPLSVKLNPDTPPGLSYSPLEEAEISSHQISSPVKILPTSTNLQKLEQVVADADTRAFNSNTNKENIVMQEMDDLFRVIRDSKNDPGFNFSNPPPVLNMEDISALKLPAPDGLCDNVELESRESADGQRNSDPDDLPDVLINPGEGVTDSPNVGLDEEEDLEDDDDDVEDPSDDLTHGGVIPSDVAADLYCNQMFIRELLQQGGVLKQPHFPYSKTHIRNKTPIISQNKDSSSPLNVQVKVDPALGESSQSLGRSGEGDVNEDASGGGGGDTSLSRIIPNDGLTIGEDLDADGENFEVISSEADEEDDDEESSNSTDSSSSNQSSCFLTSSSTFFVRPGNSLLWDILTSNQLVAELSPEQQEYVKQNLFDLIAVFLKHPEILKEMLRSLLESIHNNCSALTCVKMLQALFSNVVSLSSYAIQNHAMLDILVETVLNLVQNRNTPFQPQPPIEASVRGDTQDLLSDNSFSSQVGLTQNELGEFLHLFDAIFHKTNHTVCYTFSDDHILELWSALYTNPVYKDYFLNWLCGICQTDEIHIMTERQWLMIYCKLVMNDSQWKQRWHNEVDESSLSLKSHVASPAGSTNFSENCIKSNDLQVYTSALQGLCPVLEDLSDVHLLAVLFCKAVKGVFFNTQQSTPGSNSCTSQEGEIGLHTGAVSNASVGGATTSDAAVSESSDVTSSKSNNAAAVAAKAMIPEIVNELIAAGLRQFWSILLTSKDSDMQKMARDVLNGYYLHLPYLAKEKEFVVGTFERISKFLESEEQTCLLKLKELQSIVCLLLHHIQQSYKKYAFHIRYSALKSATTPIHSHSKTWMPRKGSHPLKLCLTSRVGLVNQTKIVTMQSSDYLGELRAEVTFHQSNQIQLNIEDESEEVDASEVSRLKYYRILTNGVELKLEHDDRTLSDLCLRDEAQISAVLTYLHIDEAEDPINSRFQLGDVFLKFPGCLYVEPPLENYPQVILLQENYFNCLFQLLRRLSQLKSAASKSQIFNIDEIIRLVWDLIMLLPTYPAIQQQFEILSTADSSSTTNRQVVAQEEVPSTSSPEEITSFSINWSAILDVDNVFKLLYSLQMLEHLAISCHSRSSQTVDAAGGGLTPRGFGGHGSTLLTPTLQNFDSGISCDLQTERMTQSTSSASGTNSQNKTKTGVGSSDWCQKFLEFGGLKFLITVFESKVLLQDINNTDIGGSIGGYGQWSEWKQECLASILRLFYIFSIHPYSSGGLVLRSQGSFCPDSLGGAGCQLDMFIAPSAGATSSIQQNPSFISMLDKTVFLDSLFIILNLASKTQTDSISRRTLSLKSNLICQCFRILNLYACHDPNVCTHLMDHELFSSLVYQLVVNFATKNISKTSSAGIAKLAQRSFKFCKKTIEKLIEFLPEVRSISESSLEDNNNRDSRDSSVIADASSGQEYFTLFENLMRIYLEKEDERVNEDDFLLFLVNSIMNALSEFFETSFSSDENGDCCSLRGLLIIMCSICRLKPPFVTSDQGLELIVTLMKCLFHIEPETKTPKFVNPDSRKAAFDLIIQLAIGSVQNYNKIYSILMEQNSKESHAPYPWSYWPLDERRSDAGFVGLINLGATCYMATALQHLFMIHEARSAILSANQNTPIKDTKNKVASDENTVPATLDRQNSLTAVSEPKHGKILLELQKMFAYLQLSDRKAYNPRSFCRSYVMDNEPLNTCDQKDMTEFFNDLIGKLEDMSPELRDLVHNLFRGEITNSVVSLDCNHVSKTIEQFYTVRCQVADLRDIYESLDEFCQIEMLEGDNMYTCSSCQTKVRAEKRASFKKLPRILVINTMRYKFNMESMAREKVNTHFSFPNHLNMGKYTETYLVGDSRAAAGSGMHFTSAATSSLDSTSQQEEMNYELIGVTVHTGAAESGHYYCYVRDRSYPQSDIWFQFNDSEVKHFNPDNIPQECFGGQMVSKSFNQLTEKFVDYAFEKPHSAYMLFYERSVDLMRSEDKTSLIQSDLNPSETFCSAINTDNLQLRHDRTLFDKNYFEFLFKFNDVVAKTLPPPLSTLSDTSSANQFEFQRAKLSTTFVLETLVHSRENPSINFWLDFITSLYCDCIDVCKWLIRHLGQNDWWLNQVLIRCPSQHIRTLFEKLIFLAITSISNKTTDHEWQLYCKNDLRTFLKTYINFTNNSVLKRRHLKHFFEYCSLLMSIAKMGKRESLLLISVGAIGHLVKFFLDVKVHSTQNSSSALNLLPNVGTNGSGSTALSDDEGEDIDIFGTENYIISSNALNELLSFNNDGKKKSALFHHVVELLETLLDRSSSSNGGAIRDFQELTRCLTDIDHAALTSNSYEFFKIVIEEGINLEGVSSILQMLIRMNSSFENFIPVRFCELILEAGSPEVVKPYFKILARLESQLQPATVTQHIIKYIPKLFQWCPISTLALLKDCAKSPTIVNWALNNLDLWVKQFLIAEDTYRVRFQTAEILMLLVPDNGQLYNYWKSYVDKFNLPDHNRSFEHDEKAVNVIHKILKHLLSLLEEFAGPSMSTYRFQYYFTVLTALTISPVEKKMFTPYFSHLWNVFYPHLIHIKVENCVNKQALLFYWHWVCLDCPQNVFCIVSNKTVLKNIFFNYILVNHEDRDLISFNKQCLHSFFGILRLCSSMSAQFCFNFMQHENFLWAMENVFPYYNFYPKASNELLKIIELLIKYGHGYSSEEYVQFQDCTLPSTSSAVSSGQQFFGLSHEDKEEILTFKRKMIFLFTKWLSKRNLWRSVPRIYSVLLETESDFAYFVTEMAGLKIVSEALCSAFDAAHHFPVFHSNSTSGTGGNSNLHSSANASLTARTDVVNLLAQIVNVYRKSIENSGAQSSHINHSEKLNAAAQWKSISVVCEKLLSLLNWTQEPEYRSSALVCLKEIISTFPSETYNCLIELMHNAHTSCNKRKCVTSAPGLFYPRSKNAKPAGASNEGSNTNLPSSRNHNATITGFVHGMGSSGGNSTCRRFELWMCVHPEHFSYQIGCNKVYDEEMRQYYLPYYTNVAQLVLAIAIQRDDITPNLIELLCALGLDSLQLRLDWFAKLLIDYYNRAQLTNALCSSPLFAQLFTYIFVENRSVLNMSNIFSFCTSFMPKVKSLSADDKNSYLHLVTSFFVSQSYPTKLTVPNQQKMDEVKVQNVDDPDVQVIENVEHSNSSGELVSKPTTTECFNQEVLISTISENLKAMQLLFTCSSSKSEEINLETVKSHLLMLQSKCEALKGVINGDPKRDASFGSSNENVLSPPKKPRLSQKTPEVLEIRKELLIANQTRTPIGSDSLPSTSSGVSSLTTTSSGSSIVGSRDQPLRNAVPTRNVVNMLLKNVTSTFSYLKQYQDRCNVITVDDS